MAERIKGLSIALDMETSGLDRSLSEIRRSFRALNTSIKTNSNNLKFGEQSIESYEKNVEALNDDIEKQRKNLEDLKKKHEDAVREQGENSKAAQALAAEYNKQADNLNRLENQLEQARKELERMKEEQRIAESGWGRMSKVFESAGGGLQRFGDQMREIGKGLTKSITAPVLGVTAAVGGMVASFGWGRLKGIDEARAQLQGMGYDTKEVEQISKEVSQAIQGGMMTMAEGTSVAAGALAAGVKQGKELERYIKLVDAAAVGANSSVSEMALIFNRVQGSGKMMTQELNMIEERMPGFSQTFADHLGVSLEEFRKMVTEGKVTSDDFLDVMEQFAGGMADAYAGTWSGMVQNTKANIGILGENLLSGVFEQSKESIAEFLELLRSEEVRTWASDMGEYIGEAFSNVVNWIKDAVNWFKELEPWQQKAIGLFAGLFVALGPLLMIGGSFLSMIGKIMTNLAPLLERIDKAGGLGKFLGGIIKTLASRFSFLLGPVGIAIGIITTLATIFTVAYKRSETFRNFVHSLGEKIREVFGKLLEWVTPGFEAVISFFRNIKKRIVDFVIGEGPTFIEAWQNIFSFITPILKAIWSVVKWAFEGIKKVINFIMPAVEYLIGTTWGAIKNLITGALDVILGAVKIFSG